MPVQDKSERGPERAPEKSPSNGAESRRGLPFADQPASRREIPHGAADDLVHDPAFEAGEGQGELFGPYDYDGNDEQRDSQVHILSADSAEEWRETLPSGKEGGVRRSDDIHVGQRSGEDRIDGTPDESPVQSQVQSPHQSSDQGHGETQVRPEEPRKNRETELPPTSRQPQISNQPAKEEDRGASGRGRQNSGSQDRGTRRRVRVARGVGNDDSARRWKSHAKQRKDTLPGYAYIVFVFILVATVYLARVAWMGGSSLFDDSPVASQRGGPAGAPAQGSSNIPMPTGANVIPWERDALQELDSSQKHAAQGALSSAEADLDRVDSSLTAARLQSQPVDPGFFGTVISALDRVLQQRPQDTKLHGLVTSTRGELASLRSAQQIPSGALGTKPVSFATSRSLSPGDTINLEALGGEYLDATVMADTVEIFAPPMTRSLADNVTVNGITIAGATQTLDGIHWRNVEFVDTRVRYADGDVDLQDVHFVRCTFTFPDDERGSQLADAIALGKSTFTIGAPAPQQNPQ